MKFEHVAEALCVSVFVILFSLLAAFPLKWCWNHVMPHVFGLPQIAWSHAWCLMWVFRSLVKSLHLHQKS